MRVEAWKSKQVRTRPLNGKRFYPVAIDYVAADTKKRLAVIRSNWIHYPNARQILFVIQLPNRKAPRIWSVLDHTQNQEAE